MKSIKSFFAIGFLICDLNNASRAADIVAPNADANVDGEINGLVPFSAGQFGIPPDVHYQQVYASNQFTTAVAYDITSIAFRADGGDGIQGNGVQKTFDIAVSLSTTSAKPNQLSSTFANNLGLNNQVVYDGSLTFTTEAGGNPNPFSFIIGLQSPRGTPFLYVPSQGNLLMDIQITGEANGFVGAMDFTTSATTSFLTEESNNPNATTGTTSADGLVTDFGVTPLANVPLPVPEPAAGAFAGLGLMLLGIGTRLRKKSSEGGGKPPTPKLSGV